MHIAECSPPPTPDSAYEMDADEETTPTGPEAAAFAAGACDAATVLRAVKRKIGDRPEALKLLQSLSEEIAWPPDPRGASPAMTVPHGYRTQLVRTGHLGSEPWHHGRSNGVGW